MADPRRTLLFLIKDDQILLAMKKRRFGAGKWNGVGGKLDPGETIEQALVRECQEEIEVTPLKYQKVAIFDFNNIGEDEVNKRNIVHTYFCSEWQGEPTETEEMKPRWFDKNKLPFEEMWEDDQYWLEKAIAGKYQKGDFVFNKDGKMISHNIIEVDKKDLDEE